MTDEQFQKANSLKKEITHLQEHVVRTRQMMDDQTSKNLRYTRAGYAEEHSLYSDFIPSGINGFFEQYLQKAELELKRLKTEFKNL